MSPDCLLVQSSDLGTTLLNAEQVARLAATLAAAGRNAADGALPAMTDALDALFPAPLSPSEAPMEEEPLLIHERRPPGPEPPLPKFRVKFANPPPSQQQQPQQPPRPHPAAPGGAGAVFLSLGAFGELAEPEDVVMAAREEEAERPAGIGLPRIGRDEREERKRPPPGLARQQ